MMMNLLLYDNVKPGKSTACTGSSRKKPIHTNFFGKSLINLDYIAEETYTNKRNHIKRA